MRKEYLTEGAENAEVGIGEHQRRPVNPGRERYSFFERPDRKLPENYEGSHHSSSSLGNPDWDSSSATGYPPDSEIAKS